MRERRPDTHRRGGVAVMNTASVIRNPILRGFNPDPSIVRVGDDYYIATSTFEWFPGVQIHHSRDLVHWRLLTRPLNRASQLDMRGDPDSCGVWAPCLTHADGLFHLIYTDVKRYGRTSPAGASGASLRDFHNYLVTSERIDGDWSDPIYLNSSGFDPSLFHDDDGRKYLVNMLWDHRPGQNRFAGIVLQEYSPRERRLVGERHNDLQGHAARLHRGAASLQARRLVLPDHRRGGTGWGHAVTMARSRTLLGPYELHPDVHILSARHRPDVALQRAGHADLVETPAGRDLHGLSVRTAARQPRPLHARTRDRDSADDVGRRRLAAHDRRAKACRSWRCRRRAASDGRSRRRRRVVREDFDADTLPIDFQWLRIAVARRAVQPRASGRGTCGFTAARRSAASSRSRSSRAGSRRTASARRRSWSSSRSTSSRWPASSATTTARSFTTSTCRATTRPASTCA